MEGVTANNDTVSKKDDNLLDVAIVGGGIAGLYCLYRLLKDKDQFGEAEKIRLFESCDHLGGRIETWSLKRESSEIGYASTWDPRHLLGDLTDLDISPYDDPEITEYLRAEFGPMRIEPRDQSLLRNLLNELGIKEPDPGAPESLDDLIPFFPYTAKEPESAKFILTGEEAEQKNTMDLLLLSIRRILEIVEGKYQDKGEENVIRWRHAEANKAWNNLRSGKSFHKHYWKGELLDWINHLEDFDPRLFAEYHHGVNAAVDEAKEEKLRKWLEENSDYYKIRLYFEIEGHPLWDMGFWNLMSDVLSHYAVVKIRDWGSYYHFLHENLNAAEWLIFWLKAIKGTHALRGIRGGMSRIIYALLFRLCELSDRASLQAEINKVQTQDAKTLYHTFNQLSGEEQKKIFTKLLAPLIKVGHELTTLELIDQRNQGAVKLIFDIKNKIDDQPSEFLAKHVILALPKLPLDKLKESLPQVLRKRALMEDAQKCEAALASVKCLPLLKCFFILEHPWWHEDLELNAAAADIPTREITYTRSKDKTKGMIMIYTDHPAITFWSDYLREFKQTAETEQMRYTVWWKDKFPLPSFERMSAWGGQWKDLARLWKDITGNEIDHNNEIAVKEKWLQMQGWWAAQSAQRQKTLRKDYLGIDSAKHYFEAKEKQQERLWNRFVQFARDYEHHDFLADHLLACGIHDWGKAPFGAAAHGWLPGEQSRKHVEFLAAFPQNSKCKGQIHVCGEAFSDYQGFIEGSLRSAEEALGRIEADRKEITG